MKLAYFSPLNPVQSGISDFSEELLPHLAEYMDIDLFVDQGDVVNQWIRDHFKIFNIEKYDDEKVRGRYDFSVFHMGNNYDVHKNIAAYFLKYGGVLELHDVSLHGFLANDLIRNNERKKYIEIMRACHGEKGRRTAVDLIYGKIYPPWENEAMEYTVNKHYIDRADAIVVHSDYAKQTVKAIASPKPIVSIPMQTPDIPDDFEDNKKRCREKIGIGTEQFVFGSFGFVGYQKRVFEILESLAHYKKLKRKFHYFIVGSGLQAELEKKIAGLQLEREVTITGFTDLDGFKTYMGACDICLNLRYPTQGETSASLHRMLGMGKPVIVTDIGSYQEYPDDIVFKVRFDKHETDDIFNALNNLTKSRGEIARISQNALRYAKENFDIKRNAKQYHRFFKDIQNSSFHETWLDSLADKVFEFDFTGETYLNHLYKKL